MPVKAILFGSIGVFAECSDLQRQAYNSAFSEAGLDWDWSPSAYNSMLGTSGGMDRLASYAKARREFVDVATLHQRKSTIFQERITRIRLPLRPGIGETLYATQRFGIPIGFVTSTSRRNVNAVIAALKFDITPADFAVITSRETVSHPKPHPEAYLTALAELGISAEDVVAIEDSPSSAKAAVAAGVPTIALPGQAHIDRPFPSGVRIVGAATPDLFGLSMAA